MQVTEVRVYPVDEEKLKAFVTITLDDCFVIRDLKIINGNKGLFVAMPSRKRKDGTYKDTAHPINNDTRKMIEDKVLAEYQVSQNLPKTEQRDPESETKQQDPESEIEK
jgi:stage V sporulation protein G